MTKSITLTQGKIALVDEEDFEKLNKHKWCFSSGYAIYKSWPGRRNVYMHRVIMNTPDGMQTDHIDGNRLNNRKSNLRIVTSSQNSMNSSCHIGGTSNYKGVSFEKWSKKWKSQIRVEGKNINLGRFKTEEEAAMEYDKAAKKYHGEFARTNL